MITIADLRANRTLIPDTPSIYLLADDEGSVYVGYAGNPRGSRFSDYLSLNDAARTIRNQLFIAALRDQHEAGAITTAERIERLELMALSRRLPETMKVAARAQMDLWTVEFVPVDPTSAKAVEADLIARLRPRMNSQRRGGNT